MNLAIAPGYSGTPLLKWAELVVEERTGNELIRKAFKMFWKFHECR